MRDWVENIRITFKESVKMDIEAESVQFVKMIGRESVSIDVHSVWVMMLLTTL